MKIVDAAAVTPEAVVSSREAVVVAGRGVVRGDAAAALMFADWAVIDRDATLVIDTPAAIAGFVWRGGRFTAELTESTEFSVSSVISVVKGLCDEVRDVPDFSGRSELALDAAAALIRSSGRDALERATFAWLFATGEPQEGLTAFLEKRKPRFGLRVAPLR